ncbi:class I SAM-dependent methyltransferase [Streptomyces sp. NPDC020917]|uniref:class I SAM-dependent methyltransferase n=1 Tax=Streptomyces sp. NPDC020917 TaxID=3365102 RepID=UPI0037ACCB8D
MAYENPLAYVLGLEGLALLRSFTGEYDREYVEARIAEVRGLLDGGYAHLAGGAVEVARVGADDGYRLWSRTYDGPNSAFDLDTPVIGEILDGMPAGLALDAACGTGRISALLAGRGHRVLGVDGSPEMLDHARARVPGGEFRLGDLHRLPVADDEVDLVVCSLALTHVPDLRPVFAEFARVLRPGGHLVTSDIHGEYVLRGSMPRLRLADGSPGRIASHRHSPGDYLRAALPTGLQVRRCEEPGIAPAEPAEPAEPAAPAEPTAPAASPVLPEFTESAGPPQAPEAAELGPWEVWPWWLADLVPEAARVANAGTPAEIIWHFQLA